MSTTTPPWKKKRPAKKKTRLTAASKSAAKASARRGGRAYPNLVDNMRAASAQKKRKKVTKKKTAKKAAKKKTTKKKAAKKKATKAHGRGHDATTRGAGVRRDPRGGLTAAGREHFRKKEGAHLKPGVKGPADTPEKMRRKGSFLRRHFASPRGPMTKPNGEPTRLALSAHAWGEPVPKTMAAAKKLAAKGTALLARYARTKG